MKTLESSILACRIIKAQQTEARSHQGVKRRA